MRDYLHIDLAEKKVRRENFSGEQVARSGRYFIARTLVDSGSATVDPLSDANPLIFLLGLLPVPIFRMRIASASAVAAR